MYIRVHPLGSSKFRPTRSISVPSLAGIIRAMIRDSVCDSISYIKKKKKKNNTISQNPTFNRGDIGGYHNRGRGRSGEKGRKSFSLSALAEYTRYVNDQETIRKRPINYMCTP
jgi:hypothetical protein